MGEVAKTILNTFKSLLVLVSVSGLIENEYLFWVVI